MCTEQRLSLLKVHTHTHTLNYTRKMALGVTFSKQCSDLFYIQLQRSQSEHRRHACRSSSCQIMDQWFNAWIYFSVFFSSYLKEQIIVQYRLGWRLKMIYKSKLVMSYHQFTNRLFLNLQGFFHLLSISGHFGKYENFAFLQRVRWKHWYALQPVAGSMCFAWLCPQLTTSAYQLLQSSKALKLTS